MKVDFVDVSKYKEMLQTDRFVVDINISKVADDYGYDIRIMDITGKFKFTPIFISFSDKSAYDIISHDNDVALRAHQYDLLYNPVDAAIHEMIEDLWKGTEKLISEYIGYDYIEAVTTDTFSEYGFGEIILTGHYCNDPRGYVININIGPTSASSNVAIPQNALNFLQHIGYELMKMSLPWVDYYRPTEEGYLVNYSNLQIPPELDENPDTSEYLYTIFSREILFPEQ